MKYASLLVALLVMATLTACGGGQVDTTIPVDEARVLNSDLTAAYVRTQELMEDVTIATRQLSLMPNGYEADDFDVAMFREVLGSCFAQDVEMIDGSPVSEVPRRAESVGGTDYNPLTERESVGGAQPCDPDRMIALEAYLDVVEDELRGFMVDQVNLVDELRVNLKHVLVLQLDDLERRAGAAEAELLRLRQTAEEKRALAQTGDVNEEQRRRTELDYDDATRELDDIEDVLEQVELNFDDFRTLRRQLVEEAARNISEIGVE